MHGSRPKQKCYPAVATAEHGAITKRNLYSRWGSPEGFAHPLPEDVVTVNLHPTKPSTSALVWPRSCPASHTVVTDWGFVGFPPHQTQTFAPHQLQKARENTAQRHRCKMCTTDSNYSLKITDSCPSMPLLFITKIFKCASEGSVNFIFHSERQLALPNT